MVVEKLEGRTVSSFIGQPPSVLQSLGEGLARIHVNKKSMPAIHREHFEWSFPISISM
ncbi:hypothetical protein ACSSTO_09320 [Bacillus atrophaeus]|uniref:hypothetical protein n=1 Tax=Bacillus atrophaeus TaxID=1452 RepID=UPI003EDABD73